MAVLTGDQAPVLGHVDPLVNVHFDRNDIIIRLVYHIKSAVIFDLREPYVISLVEIADYTRESLVHRAFFVPLQEVLVGVVQINESVADPGIITFFADKERPRENDPSDHQARRNSRQRKTSISPFSHA